MRACIGIVPQEVNFDPFFSPKKLLELQAGFYGVKKEDRITDSILETVSLDKQANAYTRSLSGGMKRRLLIAKAMVHQPPILFLDEPTAGVDVELRQNLWANVKELNKLGITIVLTTHNLNEAQEMCNRIAIINKGNLVALDTTQKLLERIESKIIKFKVKDSKKFEKIKLDGVKFAKSNGQITASYDKNKIKFDQIIEEVKKVSDKLTYFHKWEKDDLIMLDNRRFMHSRNHFNKNDSRVILNTQTLKSNFLNV